jgi:uncharacterized protein YjbI with pentapeptide repeats
MRGLKRDLWKAGIAIAGMLFLLLLMTWIPASAAGAEARTSGFAGPGTVQATPTEDATVTALNKEKLAQEVKQLQQANDRSFSQWLWVYSSTLFSTFAIVGAGLFTLIRWLDDRQKERKKQDEERQADLQKQEKERFEALSSVITGLGDEKEGTRVGAAIMLRTIFLRPGYEQFYTQIFQLVVANLRLLRTPNPPEDPAAPLPLTALSQALITAFMEAFPLARDQEKKTVGTKLATNEYKVRSTHPAPVTISSTEIRSLNALGILLDNEFLWYADLKQAWMPQASLRRTDLTGADLSEANLYAANLSEAYLWETNLSGATLWQANLCKADLRGTNLSRASLLEANLSEASLQQVDLRGADLSEANLSRASLQQVDFRGANLSKANPEDALSLTNTDLRGVKGLTKEQLEACKAKGAIIDEDPTTSPPKPTVAPSPSPQSNNAQAPSAPPAQGSTPTPETGESSTPSSKPGPQS